MHAHGREAAGGLVYSRHRPEQTQLYRLVEQHYPAFVEHLAEQGKVLHILMVTKRHASTDPGSRAVAGP